MKAYLLSVSFIGPRRHRVVYEWQAMRMGLNRFLSYELAKGQGSYRET